jgi:hypothetical protein
MKKPGPENRLFWDNEARLRAVGKGMKSPCWKGYEAIGMKTLKGKKVPNCVPKK